MGRFSKAYSTKNKKNALHETQRILGYSPWIINIPDELLLSRARFRFLMNKAKLNSLLYIYKLSEFRGGYRRFQPMVGHLNVLAWPAVYHPTDPEKNLMRSKWSILI